MADVPLTFTSDERTYGGLPAQFLKNRFFEANPTQLTGAAMIARPGTDVVGQYGTGPIRANYALPGLFEGSLFTVSGETLYRTTPDGQVIEISGIVFNTGEVSMTGVAGAGYQRLFVADGSLLQFYPGGTQATGTLTASDNVAEGNTVRIGDTWYKWTATVETGSGTEADPWDVLLGGAAAASMGTLFKALNYTGVRGTDYSSNLGGQNLDVTAEFDDVSVITVTARSDLAAGNDVVTATTAADAAWSAATLAGGGVHGLSGVEVPDGLPPIYVATLKSHIVVAIGGSDRFFWVNPGAVEIESLDFATAESQPDDVLAVTVVGDTVWFVGEGSTEVWYATGDGVQPFAPVNGRVYDRGAVEGTVVNIKGTVFLVGRDNIVYAIGGSSQRVSNHGVEQILRSVLGG